MIGALRHQDAGFKPLGPLTHRVLIIGGTIVILGTAVVLVAAVCVVELLKLGR